MVPRLFTRFVHDGDAPLTEGSVGLGLAVVKMLAEEMGGSIEYDRRNGWTLFTLSLPVASRAADEVDAPPAVEPDEIDSLRQVLRTGVRAKRHAARTGT